MGEFAPEAALPTHAHETDAAGPGVVGAESGAPITSAPRPMAGLLRGGPLAAGAAGVVRRKLVVGASDDRHEREADESARLIVERLRDAPAEPSADEEAAALTVADPPVVARAASVVGAAGGELDASTTDRLSTARSGGGRPLAAGVRRRFEGAMGADLSAVRVHTGPAVSELNHDLSARAFTLGTDVFFRDGMPSTDTAQGQELLAHELTHTVQQSGSAQRVTDTIRRDKTKGAADPAPTLDPLTDWVALTTRKAFIGTKSRSKGLLEVDAAVKKWVETGSKLKGGPQQQLDTLAAIMSALDTWSRAKGSEAPELGTQVGQLTAAVKVQSDDATQRLQARLLDESAAADLHGKAHKMDSETGKFAKRNAVDVKVDSYKASSQTPGLMALTKKNADGTLTDEALDYFDNDGIAKAKEIKEKASKFGFTSDTALGGAEIKKAMEKQKNSLTNRTEIPELANVGVDNGEPQGEKNDPLPGGGSVTYDPSDVHAEERLASLKAAIELIGGSGVAVPVVEFYLPKFGRDVHMGKDCAVTFPSKIADAQFLAPGFVYINSQNTGNPKTNETKGELNFLSARLGAEQGLEHSIVHELGHAAHYANDRKRFHNLGWSDFKPGPMANDKRSARDVVAQEVSPYGAGNPREMVAEVFLGTLLGKKFPPIVWEMYEAFGGAPVPH